MSLLTNLVSHYKLDETVSATAVDVHGSNTLSQSGGVGSATGKIGNGRDFESSSSQYLSAASAAWNQTGNVDFAFGCWVQLESSTGTAQAIVSKRGGAGAREYWLQYNDGSNRFRFVVSSDGTAETNVSADAFGAISTGVFYYVLGWHDAANDLIGVSVNGVENTAAYSSGVFTGSAEFRVGGAAVGAFAFDGVLDELSFWKGGIPTAGERVALYNGGNGRAYETFSLMAPKLHHYRQQGICA